MKAKSIFRKSYQLVSAVEQKDLTERTLSKKETEDLVRKQSASRTNRRILNYVMPYSEPIPDEQSLELHSSTHQPSTPNVDPLDI